MMLDRYLARVVLGASAVALLVLVGLSALFTFIGEADNLGKGVYGTGHAALYVALLLPQMVYDFMPAAVLIGAIMGLGSLAAGNELTAMQAGGVSVLRLSRPVLLVGLLASLVSFAIGELIAPETTREGIAMRAEARQAGVSLGKRDSFWAREGGRFIHVGAVTPDGRLERIRIFEFDGLRLQRSIHVDSAILDQDGWLLEGLLETRLGDGGARTRRAARERWQQLIDPALVNLLEIEPEIMSARELHDYVDYLEQNNLDSRRYELAFWIKMAGPVIPLAMVLLATPFVFGSLRSAGGGQRLMVGILLGISVHVVNQAMSHGGLVLGLPAVLAATLPPLMFVAIGLGMLARTGRR